MRKLILIVVVALLTLNVARAQEGVSIPPKPSAPGELVDVGNFLMHLYCVGEGSPTVILEPGFARFSLNVRSLQLELAQVTRVCAYDHAGLGWSDPASEPRTTLQLTAELAALLQYGGVPAPYVLVAHSLGGFIARMFAAMYPDQVAGVILLEATPPTFFTEGVTADQDRMLDMILRASIQVAEAGAWNPQTLAPVAQLLTDVPPEFHDAVLALATQSDFMRAAAAEWENRVTNAQSVIDAGGFDAPLIVLAAGDRLRLSSEQDAAWVRGQLANAELSPDAELRFVVGGDHSFYVSQPEVVREALEQIIHRG